MIVFEGAGDLFSCEAHTLVCPVNSAGAMGKGLAYRFRLAVPGLYDFYRQTYPYDPPHAPTGRAYRHRHTLAVFSLPDGRQVLLFPTKVYWTHPTPVEVVEENLQQLAASYGRLGVKSLAVPPLGCGLGGRDYETEIRPLLYRYLDPLPVPVQILHG